MDLVCFHVPSFKILSDHFAYLEVASWPNSDLPPMTALKLNNSNAVLAISTGAYDPSLYPSNTGSTFKSLVKLSVLHSGDDHCFFFI